MMLNIHIILSTIAFVMMVFAASQALLLALHEYLLRHFQSPFLLKYLPPLQTMERILFQLIIVGFILLSLVLISSVLFFQIFSPALIHKTVLTLFAWGVFAALLLGRFLLGWRGRIAIRWTLAGVILLTIIYCGSGFLLHLSNQS